MGGGPPPSPLTSALLLIRAFGESKHIFRIKSNTAVEAKDRQLAWERIAD